VPFAAGGSADTVARIVAPKLGESLGQSVLVDNRPGANGNIGTAAVAQATADGYTLLLAFDATLVINPHVYPKLGFDPIRDFQPITMLVRVPMILAAHPSFPANNVSELVALAKKQPSLTYSSAGLASTPHLAMLLFEQRTGTRFEHIAYKGGGQAVVDTLAGHVPLISTGFPVAFRHLQSRKLKGIGIMSAKRHPSLPDVGTFGEAGIADFDLSFWLGIVAPAGIPRDIVARLNTDLRRVLDSPEVRAKVSGGVGGELAADTPEQFAADIRKDLERWGRVVREGGVKVD
jgi:tripartite-type tricarboxylate transporter receptor subunit TctC